MANPAGESNSTRFSSSISTAVYPGRRLVRLSAAVRGVVAVSPEAMWTSVEIGRYLWKSANSMRCKNRRSVHPASDLYFVFRPGSAQMLLYSCRAAV